MWGDFYQSLTRLGQFEALYSPDERQCGVWRDKACLHCVALTMMRPEDPSCQERISPEDAQLQAQLARSHVLPSKAVRIQNLL